MSKYVKNLVIRRHQAAPAERQRRAAGEHDRHELLLDLYVAEGAARQEHQHPGGQEQHGRAGTAGTPLAKLFDGVGGSAAICWGSEDIVSLAKAITDILKSDKFPAFQPRGGVMDGEQISADQIAEVAKWPNRTEQLSLLLGQILSVGSRLNGQLLGSAGHWRARFQRKPRAARNHAAREVLTAEAAGRGTRGSAADRGSNCLLVKVGKR